MTVKRMNSVQTFMQYDGTNGEDVADFLGSFTPGYVENGFEMHLTGTDPLRIEMYSNPSEMVVQAVDIASGYWVTPWFAYSDTDLAALYSPANETP